MAGPHRFLPADYVVFSMTLLLSIGIGVYYALTGGKQRTTSEFLLAGRKMHFLPVAISMFVTYKSSILMLGYPAEAYAYGFQMVQRLIPHLLANILSVWLVVPLIYPLKITSVYEYLELRFNSRAVRLVNSCAGLLHDLCYMGIVLYGPAIALKAVTGFPLWISISGLAFVSMIYTSMGGLKAVIWTDVLQTFVMFGGILAVLIKGSLEAGGARAVWNKANAGGRINFFNFDLDPTVRHTFWNLCLNGFLRGFDAAFSQSTIQRVGSCSTMEDAKRVMLFEGPAAFIVSVLALYEGIVAYAYYAQKECDPFQSGQLTNPNQIIPFMVMDVFESPFGLAGLFVASLFSASLSTLSSCQNSFSALLWTDIIKPLVGNISETTATHIAKVSVIVSGVLACGMAWLISLVGGPLQQISSVLLTALGSPQMGIFILACYSPRTNAKGAVIGGILSFFLCMWISLGMSFTPGRKRTPYLPPAPMGNCAGNMTSQNTASYWPMTNSSDVWVTTTMSGAFSGNITEEDGLEGIEKIYTMSYTFIPVIGMGSAMLFGYVFSILTGSNKPGQVDPRYLVSFVDSMLIFLPRRIRQTIKSWGTQPITKWKQDSGDNYISSSSSQLNDQKASNPLMLGLATTMDDNYRSANGDGKVIEACPCPNSHFPAQNGQDQKEGRDEV